MKLTVVIPCKNEAPYIEECLDAIYNCEVPENTEISVFVVDGMSDDGTRDIVTNLKSKYSTLDLVDNKKELTPFAFNLGIYAGGKVDYLQIVGARHILSENYLIRCIKKLQEDESTWCVGGRIINEFINADSKTIAKAMGTSFGMGIGNFRTLQESGFTDTVTSPMYPYWVFEKIGFFDEELIRNQDDDFNYRVSKAGGKIYYDHEISLKYYVRGSFEGLYRQFFQYGYWKVYVNKKHKAVTTLRQLAPPLFVLYLFTLVFSPILGDVLAMIYSLPITAYLILVIYKGFELGKKEGDTWNVILSFVTMHFSYGLGYLNGLLHFLILGKKPSANQKRMSR